MKVVFHDDFYQVYAAEPAAYEGRIEAVVEAIKNQAEYIEAIPADEEEIAAVHTSRQIDHVKRHNLYDIPKNTKQMR